MAGLVFVIIFSVLLGACLGAYCQLYYLVKNIMFSWEALLSHAIAKRRALLSLSILGKLTIPRLSQETEFLCQHHKISWRIFLKHSYDILFAFQEMEETLPQLVQEILEAVGENHEQESIVRSLEDFWARDNLFAFETSAYEQAVEKYLKQRSSASLWVASRMFRFLDLPMIHFSR
ncbi:conserved hypothetical protein [Chlamydia felis Fe/C-56]|uniref:Uncharacterized protein n=1 Tax=Chlamydia felis (strain Fe/C-56) TaxID=264202 RepID=Q256A4_CHLFF|nr:hypothetical protein [Chlamydia felis]BAE80884.1 conserved hypothetical protein [Chlamydia felis Fe/C-56]